MALISISEELSKKSFTSVENKFITKYMPVLEPISVKVYLYALYLYQNGLSSYTLEDMAQSLAVTEDELKNYFEYLEEFELVSVLSFSPFEVKLLDADNSYGTPKKFKPEKYSDFTKNVQAVLKGRMISTNEFREYFILLEEYGFEQNALIMIINYCVNLKGDNIRLQYIKKVAKSFAEDGAVTAKKVDERLSAYTQSTPSLLKIFTSAGINKQPDVEDDKLYKKWTEELGFDDNAIICAAKNFKAKTCEKIDSALYELYKNKKFDVKEIEDYCKTKNSVYKVTLEIAKSLGVYMQNSLPYVENYVNVWYNYGYSFNAMKIIADYCFKHGKNSFEAMDDFIKQIYNEGIVADVSLNSHISELENQDNFIKSILSVCGLTRKIIDWDRQSLIKWRTWGFSDEMITQAAKLSAGKSNPMAYINGILSAWKKDNVNDISKINLDVYSPVSSKKTIGKAEIERHYYDLRHYAEDKAEKTLQKALSDKLYGEIYEQINKLSIDLAFAEIKDEKLADELNKKIAALTENGDERLKKLNIDKNDFIPNYSCKICNDTGYEENGSPCKCLKKFLNIDD